MWRPAVLLLLCSLPALAQPAQAPLTPDVALCLPHFRAGEAARAEKVLGPLESLPTYRVDVEVDPLAGRAEGQLELQQWVSESPVREVFLQVTPNAQDPTRVRVSGVTVNGSPASLSQHSPTLLRVSVSPPAMPGTFLRLRAHFEGRVPEIDDNPLGGLSTAAEKREPTDYGAFGRRGPAMSLVGLIPRAPPLKPDGTPRDGPSGLGDLASYDPAHLVLSVSVPHGYEVEATGIELGAESQGSRMRYRFGAAAARDFPLFVTHGYEMQSQSTGDITVSVHAAPEHAEAAARVLEYTVAALRTLEKRLGKTPYRRFRVVEAPLQSGAGGMEFPGLISVSSMLISGGLGILDGMGVPPEQLGALKELVTATSSLSAVVENTLEFTVAHEVAHQYFAMLVGSDPITEPAVDETLAQYTALLYLEWKHGKEAAANMRNGQVVASYLLFRMMGGEDGSVERPTSAFASGLEYAALVYGKGPMLHEAERHLLGDAAFVRGLRRYVDEYRYRWACGDCLTQVLAREAPGQASELHRLHRHWWKEAHGDEDLGTLESLAESGGGPVLNPAAKDLMDQVLKEFQ
jgi:hypothetical protein